MIVSIALSFTNGSLWACAEDFESAEEGFLFAKARGFDKYGDIDRIVVVPHRATGLVMCREIQSRLRQVRTSQGLRGLRAFPC